MSGIGNSYINLAPPSAGLPYELQLAQIQRQQRLAEQLQQQNQDAIPVQSGGGAPAPIGWGSVLGKALQSGIAAYKQSKADDQLKQLGQQDTASAQALAQALSGTPTNQVGVPDLPPINTQISAATPMLPGQAPAPQAPMASVQVPGQMGTGAQSTIVPPTQQEALAAALAAHGGPQTDAIRNAMLPQILNRQNMDYEDQLKRGDLTFQNQMPISAATQQQIAAQGQQEQANARFANQLAPTAQQQLQNRQAQATLAEEHSYHQSLTGAGLASNDPQTGYWTQAVLSGNVPGVQAVPKQFRNGVAANLAQTPGGAYAPIASTRFARASNSIVGPLMKLPQYELTANGLPYIQRIQAALTKPGSVSDQELLDSFTKLSTSGNAITDAQVRIITDGKSLSDWASTLQQKLGSGGVLSADQRQQIAEIANRTYNKYKEGYDPLYKEATDKLTAAGVPKPFWTIPDLNKLNSAQTGGAASPPPAGANIAPAGTKATGPGGKVLTSDGKGGWN